MATHRVLRVAAGLKRGAVVDGVLAIFASEVLRTLALVRVEQVDAYALVLARIALTVVHVHVAKASRVAGQALASVLLLHVVAAIELVSKAEAVFALVVQALIGLFVAKAAKFARWAYADVAASDAVALGVKSALCMQTVVDTLLAVSAREALAAQAREVVYQIDARGSVEADLFLVACSIYEFALASLEARLAVATHFATLGH